MDKPTRVQNEPIPEAVQGQAVAGWVNGDAFVDAMFWTDDEPPHGWTPVYTAPLPSVEVDESVIARLKEAYDFGQFSDDFNQPLARLIRKDIRSLLRTLTAEQQQQQQGQAVAWCQLTQSGKIAYFDGKPMIMVGPVGNEHHPTPLYTPAQPMQQGGGEVYWANGAQWPNVAPQSVPVGVGGEFDKVIEDMALHGTGVLRVEHVPHADFHAPQPAAVNDLNAWRAAFVAERAMRYREGGMAIEQARIHAETDAAHMEALAASQQPAAVDEAWQVQLAEALECFWNPAIEGSGDDRSNIIGGMVQGFAAVAYRLREQAALAAQQQEPKSCNHDFRRDEDNGGNCCQLCDEVKP